MSLASLLLAAALAVAGPQGRIELTAADVAALPRRTVKVRWHNQDAVYEGPLLSQVLAKAGAPVGEALRGGALGLVVRAQAADGYRVAFSLAETDPGLSRDRVIVADRKDGAPLSAEEGPLRLVVEGDLRPARSARRLTALEVKAVD